jgi:hypothetical protein
LAEQQQQQIYFVKRFLVVPKAEWWGAHLSCTHTGNHPSTRGISQLFSSNSGDFGHIFFTKKSFAWVTLDFIFLLLPSGEIHPIFLIKKIKLKLLVHVQNNKLASCKN